MGKNLGSRNIRKIEKPYKQGINMHPIRKILISKNSAGTRRGIYSACTANRQVIAAVCERALETNTFALIEATANQVNQFGGYTGMIPQNYADMVFEIAKKAGLPKERVILGGDHLGPLTWQNEDESPAMEKACTLIRAYVAAGYTKIHIDTSMRLASDDKNMSLTNEIIAKRGAELALAAEEAFKE